ncbi:MAG TPA: helix-turn-helix domain-containing protein [Nocardioidaceae bacterium]
MTSPERARWTFLTNHAHVLLLIATDPEIRLREVAERIGITERAAQAIVKDLCAAGYLTRQRVGRRNHYTVDARQPMRHREWQGHAVGELLAILVRERTPAP